MFGIRWTVVIIVTMSTGIAVSAHDVHITTAQGRGADATISAGTNDPAGDESQLLLRYQPHENAGQKVYLRFDLAAVPEKRDAVMHVEQAALLLQPIGFPIGAECNVFAVRAAAPADWSEPGAASGDHTITWDNAPANDLQAFGGYYIEPPSLRMYGGIRRDASHFLGRISLTTIGQQVRLSGPALALFLNQVLLDDAGRQTATLVITRADRSPAPVALASHENAALEPPTLELRLSPQPLINAAERLCRQQVQIPAPQTIESVWSDVQLDARSGGSWKSALPNLATLVQAMQKAPATPGEREQSSSIRKSATDLARLLQLEGRSRAAELSRADWAKQTVAILNAQPDGGGALALYRLSGWHGSGAKSETAGRLALAPLLDAGVVGSARAQILQIVDAQDNSPGDAVGRLAYYRKLLPAAPAQPWDSYSLSQYLAAVEHERGRPAAGAVLDQLASAHQAEPIGVAATLMRIHREQGERRKAAMVIDAVETNPPGVAAGPLRPYYLAAMQKLGRLQHGLSVADPSASAASASSAPARVQQLRQLVLQAPSLLPYSWHAEDEPPVFALGPAISPLGLCAAVAEEDLRQDQPARAAEMALEALRAEGNCPRSILSTKEPAAAADLAGPLDTPDDQQAAASILLSLCYQRLGDAQRSRSYREAAAASKASKPLLAYATICSVQDDLRAGDADAIARDVKRADALALTSPTIALLKTASDAASPKASDRSALDGLDQALKSAETQSDPAQSQAMYIKAAQLCEACGSQERAISIYVAMVKRHPKGDQAPAALARCVRLLESDHDPVSNDRLKKFRQALVDRLGSEKAAALIGPRPTTAATQRSR